MRVLGDVCVCVLGCVCVRVRACVQTVRVCSSEIDIDTYGGLCDCRVCVACFSVLVRARCAAPVAAPEFNPPGLFALGASLRSFGATPSTRFAITCPAGMVSMPIGSDLCERAAVSAGRPYGGNVTIFYMLYGCVWYSAGGSFHFNAYKRDDTDESGRVHFLESAQPVCAGAPCFCTAAAISRSHICVWVRVCVCACMCVCNLNRLFFD
jgi:hypothetical protein